MLQSSFTAILEFVIPSILEKVLGAASTTRFDSGPGTSTGPVIWLAGLTGGRAHFCLRSSESARRRLREGEDLSELAKQSFGI